MAFLCADQRNVMLGKSGHLPMTEKSQSVYPFPGLEERKNNFLQCHDYIILMSAAS